MTSRKTIQDDCFRASKPRMLHRDALELLEARTGPIADIETVGLFDAAGRVLAEDVASRAPVPARDNAAVDGYGFAHSQELQDSGGELPLIGQAAAGHPFAGPVPAGSAIRILTGALVPEGVETIIMNEDTEVLDARAPGGAGGSESGSTSGRIRFGPGVKKGANIRRSGEDVAEGQRIFRAGHVVRPQDLAALASVGAGTVACRKRLRVGIISTGDEVRRAGEGELAPGQVYDANAPMLAALVHAAGCEAFDLGIWEDDRAILAFSASSLIRCKASG